MASPRDIRRLAMQVLYQIDLTAETDRATLLDSLDGDFDDEITCEEAVDLALAAWEVHKDADAAIVELAPEWPTYRQPPVDRAILRLASHEIQAGQTPPKVAVNEAVELSKQYAAEESPAFVNAVLDKLLRKVAPEALEADAPAEPAKPTSKDAWLDDAIDA